MAHNATMVKILCILAIALTGCAAEAVPIESHHAEFQGSSAEWTQKLGCKAPTCQVTGGQITSAVRSDDGAFTCKARIEPGATLEMVLTCP